MLEEKLNTLSESIDREKGHLQNDLVQMRSDTKLSISRISADVSSSDLLYVKASHGDFIILILHHLSVQLEKMEFRAKNAEKESTLLKEQLEELKKQLDKVTISMLHLYGVYAIFNLF